MELQTSNRRRLVTELQHEGYRLHPDLIFLMWLELWLSHPGPTYCTMNNNGSKRFHM